MVMLLFFLASNYRFKVKTSGLDPSIDLARQKGHTLQAFDITSS